MISVEEARERINEHLGLLPEKEIPLHQVKGHYAATDIHAQYDHPLFNNSAVDGYAFAFDDNGEQLKVIGEVAAGDVLESPLTKGGCVRIFTGAMLPTGADTVVMQEFVTRTGNLMGHTDERLVRGANVRLKGEQVKTGDLVLKKGSCITAATAGLLASIGIRKLKVHEWPYVSVVITGGEFAGEEPLPGQIFGSNDLMLTAALRTIGIEPTVLYAADEPEALNKALRQALSNSDVVITTGGVSVGDHDLVHPTLSELGMETTFHKVAQKPGKPMLFGKAGGSVVFGLPGNPRAVMILFWEYVLPAIRTMMGAAHPYLKTEMPKITSDVLLKGDRSEFRAARINDGTVELLRDEGSHMLSSLKDADALVYFPAHVRQVDKGSKVEVHHIPGQ